MDIKFLAQENSKRSWPCQQKDHAVPYKNLQWKSKLVNSDIHFHILWLAILDAIFFFFLVWEGEQIWILLLNNKQYQLYYLALMSINCSLNLHENLSVCWQSDNLRNNSLKLRNSWLHTIYEKTVLLKCQWPKFMHIFSHETYVHYNKYLLCWV